MLRREKLEVNLDGDSSAKVLSLSRFTVEAPISVRLTWEPAYNNTSQGTESIKIHSGGTDLCEMSVGTSLQF